MSKECDRRESRWHVMIVLMATIIVVYVVSVLLSQASMTL